MVLCAACRRGSAAALLRASQSCEQCGADAPRGDVLCGACSEAASVCQCCRSRRVRPHTASASSSPRAAPASPAVASAAGPFENERVRARHVVEAVTLAYGAGRNRDLSPSLSHRTVLELLAASGLLSDPRFGVREADIAFAKAARRASAGGAVDAAGLCEVMGAAAEALGEEGNVVRFIIERLAPLMPEAAVKEGAGSEATGEDSEPLRGCEAALQRVFAQIARVPAPFSAPSLRSTQQQPHAASDGDVTAALSRARVEANQSLRRLSGRVALPQLLRWARRVSLVPDLLSFGEITALFRSSCGTTVGAAAYTLSAGEFVNLMARILLHAVAPHVPSLATARHILLSKIGVADSQEPQTPKDADPPAPSRDAAATDSGNNVEAVALERIFEHYCNLPDRAVFSERLTRPAFHRLARDARLLQLSKPALGAADLDISFSHALACARLPHSSPLSFRLFRGVCRELAAKRHPHESIERAESLFVREVMCPLLAKLNERATPGDGGEFKETKANSSDAASSKDDDQEFARVADIFSVYQEPLFRLFLSHAERNPQTASALLSQEATIKLLRHSGLVPACLGFSAAGRIFRLVAGPRRTSLDFAGFLHLLTRFAETAFARDPAQPKLVQPLSSCVETLLFFVDEAVHIGYRRLAAPSSPPTDSPGRRQKVWELLQQQQQ